MFKKNTLEREIYDKAYMDGWVGRPDINPYETKVLANAWQLGYNSGKADKLKTETING